MVLIFYRFARIALRQSRSSRTPTPQATLTLWFALLAFSVDELSLFNSSGSHVRQIGHRIPSLSKCQQINLEFFCMTNHSVASLASYLSRNIDSSSYCNTEIANSWF
ncbi:hypothetical protein V6N11_060374 [Hibiscus sabdariffa]|uniref:Secreted protein n=1 Tax=Hibiscus sabdariffa TaxID=183260 RepID=A0ABR2QQ99_9ROSI